MTVILDRENSTSLQSRWDMYFYVPKGTKIVGLYAAGSGKLLNGDGKTMFDFGNKKENFFSIPVPEGQDGKLWKFERVTGQKVLLTVPPFTARNGEELLLPKEIIERDFGRIN